MRHHYLGSTLYFEIKYKNRTSIGIYLKNGMIEVQAPRHTPDEKVIQVLEEKWDVIQQKLGELNEQVHGPKNKVYDHGESFLYLGENYPIKITHDSTIDQDNVAFDGQVLHIYVKQLEDEKIRQALKRFYYKQCKALVEKRIISNQSYFKQKPRSIRITDSKTTWGTCDSNQQLTFNWRLAMAPMKVIDYVVVHEMCHMVHLNHDRSFWRLVGKIMPDYEEQENWLAYSNWKMTI